MPKESLYRFTCEKCGEELISSETPRGWVRILAGERSHGTVHPKHHIPAVLWTPTLSAVMPADGYWCSSDCLVATVKTLADDLIDRAKLR